MRSTIAISGGLSRRQAPAGEHQANAEPPSIGPAENVADIVPTQHAAKCHPNVPLTQKCRYAEKARLYWSLSRFGRLPALPRVRYRVTPF